jgi:hypothetical protein
VNDKIFTPLTKVSDRQKQNGDFHPEEHVALVWDYLPIKDERILIGRLTNVSGVPELPLLR